MRTLLRLALFALNVSAFHTHLRPRADQPSVQDIQDFESVSNDGPTSDRAAGLGVEFESFSRFLRNTECSLTNTQASKGKIVAGRQGTNWKLTADTSENPGYLSLEYVLDGTAIKVGTGTAAATGTAIGQDLMNWPEFTCNAQFDVQDSQCNPWNLLLSKRDAMDPAGRIQWAAQATAPMPFEAIYFLWKRQFLNQVTNDASDPNAGGDIFVGYTNRARTSLVTKAHFQSNKNGIDPADMTDDVLGFCTLVMSYAKAANGETLKPGSSPKIFTTFMPRTEFNTMFKQVSSKLKGDLFTLFDSLACYTTQDPPVLDQNGDPVVVVDTAYCSSDVSNPQSDPQSNGVFAKLQYATNGATVNVQEWITGIGSGSPSPDRLTTFDEAIDGSIGGLTINLENMFNLQRPVPLFEFRDLNSYSASQFGTFMGQADQAVQWLHNRFASAP